MFNSQINILKSGIKNGTQVTINLSSNINSDANDQTNFPHKLLLANTQVSKIRKGFANDPTAIIKFSKTQMSKMVQLRIYLAFNKNRFAFDRKCA